MGDEASSFFPFRARGEVSCLDGDKQAVLGDDTPTPFSFGITAKSSCFVFS